MCPEHLPRWMLGPKGWTMPVCEIDLRLGGAWHFVSELNGRTTLTMRILYPTQEARDAAIKTGMKDGMSECFDRLVDHLPTMA